MSENAENVKSASASLSTRARRARTTAASLIAGAIVPLVVLLPCSGLANAQSLSCMAPEVQEWLRAKANKEIAHTLNPDTRAVLFPNGTYALEIKADEWPEVSYYRTCRGTITISAGNLRANVAISFDFPRDASSPNALMWGYAPYSISQLINAFQAESRAAAVKDASQQAEQHYKDTRAKGEAFCPDWLDERDNRERAGRAAYWISQSFRLPKTPEDALESAQNTLVSALGLNGERGAEARRMTESDFQSCVPEIGKLLVENKRRESESLHQKEIAMRPAGRLLEAYKDYIAVKQCADSRASYEIKYIQDSELDEARCISKMVEDTLMSADPSIDKEKVWDDAQQNPTTRANDIDPSISGIMRMTALTDITGNEFTDAGQSFCRSSLNALRSFQDALAPETKKVRKDF